MQGCQGGEGTVGVSLGVRAADSRREGKPILDGGYYLFFPISSFYGVDSGGYSSFIGEKMGLGECRAQSHPVLLVGAGI